MDSIGFPCILKPYNVGSDNEEVSQNHCYWRTAAVEPMVKPVGNPIVNPIGSPIINPIGNPTGNPIVDPIGNPIGDPMIIPIETP